MTRWKRTTLDQTIPAWTRGEFTIHLGHNHGRQGPGQRDRAGHHWWYVVETTDGALVGEAPTLGQAKALVAA